jgi:hypothetical protein
MNCIEVTSLDEAMKTLPSSVVPINGLRRDNEGNLTADALRMIVDGLKSRGIDPTDTAVQDKLQFDLNSFLCSLNNQYKVLLKELFRLTTSKQPVSKEFVEIIKDKNITMQDVINVSRHLTTIRATGVGMPFIEAWQNTPTSQPTMPKHSKLLESLKEEFTNLEGGDLEKQKEMVKLTEETNKVAHNYLGLYGFLNLFAIGLMIYIAAGPNKPNLS